MSRILRLFSFGVFGLVLNAASCNGEVNVGTLPTEAGASGASTGAADGTGSSSAASGDATDGGGNNVADDAGIDASDGGGIDTMSPSCAGGAACSAAGNPCRTGTTSCASGVAACAITGTLSDGTPCGANQVCHGGACTACAAGILCNPSGNPCQSGVTSCASGVSTCAAMGNAADGTPCGTNQVCLNGACGACTAGASCHPNGNVCLTGTISCSAGQPTCVSTGDVADGTACPAGICCGGACAACPPSSNQTLSCSGGACTFGCTGGLTLCGGVCVDTTSDAKGCGPWCTACPAGSLCTNSRCSLVEYGNFTPYQPCNSGPGSYIRGGFLGGETVQIAVPITVTSLGVIGTPHAGGVKGILALYSQVTGAPGALMANTASTTIASGSSTIPVVTPALVPAGTYWIMAEYEADAQICVDSSMTNRLDYIPITYGVLPNPFLIAPMWQLGVNFNYFVVGAP